MKIFNLVITISCFMLLIHACCKEKTTTVPTEPTPIPTPRDPIIDICAKELQIKSIKLADNIYKGKIVDQCPAFAEYVGTDKFSYNQLSVNPNNEYEFCTVRQDNAKEFNNEELIKFNICTGKTTIITRQPTYDIDWSVKDWVLFRGGDKQLRKIKSNGDSLTQLTYTGAYNNYAKWNNEGTKYLYIDGKTSKEFLADEFGQIIQTFEPFGGRFDWLSKDEIIYYGYNKNQIQCDIVKYNINTKQREIQATLDDFVLFLNIKNNEILFDSNSGFYSMKDKVVTKIGNKYDSYFGVFSQTMNDKYYIVNKVILDTTGLKKCKIYTKNFITIFDKNTKEERQIQIPE